MELLAHLSYDLLFQLQTTFGSSSAWMNDELNESTTFFALIQVDVDHILHLDILSITYDINILFVLEKA